MYITDDGYQVKSYEEILSEVTNDIKKGIPELNTQDSNPLMSVFKKWSDMLYQLSLSGLTLYISRSVASASGDALDRVVENLYMTRKGTTPSYGDVTFYGVDGTVIPQNFLVTTSNKRTYVTTKETTITNGFANVEVVSQGTGADTRADVGDINKTVSLLNGVSYVVNDNAVVGGNDVESDVELRNRYRVKFNGLGKSTILSLYSAIRNETDVIKVNILENATSTEDVANGLPSHTFKVITVGGEQEDILYNIYDSRPLGILPIGDITTDYNGYVSAYSTAVDNPLNFSVTISANENSSLTDAIDTIKNDIVDTIDKLDIGDTIKFSDFISAMYKSTGDYITSFTNFEFWTDPLDKKTLGEEIPQTNIQNASISVDEISIVVV